MHQLFPPYLNKGSKDLGLHGPVRKLQETLAEDWPGLSKLLNLVIDGDYGDVTTIMVAATQDECNRQRCINQTWLDVDGNFGPDSRKGFRRDLKWKLNTEFEEFVPGGECMYVGPDSPEPILWNPLADPGENVVTAEMPAPQAAAAEIPKE
jgi:hypothetical protein